MEVIEMIQVTTFLKPETFMGKYINIPEEYIYRFDGPFMVNTKVMDRMLDLIIAGKSEKKAQQQLATLKKFCMYHDESKELLDAMILTSEGKIDVVAISGKSKIRLVKQFVDDVVKQISQQQDVETK